jgi:hypothetical protein
VARVAFLAGSKKIAWPGTWRPSRATWSRKRSPLPDRMRRLHRRQSLARRMSPTQLACAVTALSILLASCGAAQDRHPGSATVSRPGFAVFDDAPTPSDALTEEVAGTLSRNVQPEFGKAEIADARRVLANDPGWLVPAANGEICLVQLIYPVIGAVHGEVLPPTPETACQPEALAEAGQLVGTHSLSASLTQATDSNVTGVAPNGVATVTIVSSRGRSTSVDVIRNAYEVVVADPVAVRFTTTSHGKPITHTVRLTTFSGGARHVEG